MMPDVVEAARVEPFLCWRELCAAFAAGHALERAQITDSFLYSSENTLLSRAAWIKGMGLAVKTATVFPGNPARGEPMVNGAVSLFDDAAGRLEALVDFHLVTKWKTAGDSAYAASRLARRGSRKLLIIGAGSVARAVREAYGALFEGVSAEVWNRSPEGARALAECYEHTRAVEDLAGAVGRADMIVCATMSREPVLQGRWLRAGQHVDLIGAYRPDMREADDEVLRRGRLFVDSYATTLEHIGEVKIPLEQGVITRSDVVADFYEPNAMCRRDDAEITVFKNGGGAHLDLMASRYILEKWRENCC